MMKKIFWTIMAFALAFHPLFAALKAGKSAPDFNAIATNGGKVSVAEYKGKNPVVLYFWDAGFDICRKELKELNRQYKAYAREGVKVFAVNINRSTDGKARDFVSFENISVPLVLDAEGKISGLYDIKGVVPTLYLIDKSGKISYQWEGSFSVARDLNPKIGKLVPNSTAGNKTSSAGNGKQAENQAPQAIPGETDEHGGTVYLIPKTPLQITFPRGWVMRKEEKRDLVHVFFRPGKNDSWRIAVIRVDENVDAPPPMLMKNFIDSMRNQHQDSFIEIAKPAPVPGRPFTISYAFGFTNEKGVQIAQVSILKLLPAQRKVVWFMYGAPASGFQARQGEIRTLIQSVRPHHSQGPF